MTCSYIRRLEHQPSSKKLLSVVEGNLYRDPYLVNVQRVRDAVNGGIYLTLALCEDQRSLKNNEKHNDKRQRQWMTPTKWHFPSTKGQLHVINSWQL